MRILLTACEGQLGRALTRVLPEHGELFAVSRADFDLSLPEKMGRILEELRPELIVNAAAYTAVDPAETDRETALAVNAVGPDVMARWAFRNQAMILHYSTDYVFDGENTAPYREDDATNPINVYGETKRAGERLIMESGARYLIVRSSWLYDAVGKNFLTTILRLAGERDELQVVDDQFGAPTPTWWLADTTAYLLMRKANGVLNAAPDGSTSWHGFASAIIDEMKKRGRPLKVRHLAPIGTEDWPTPAKRPRNSVFALTRLHEEYGAASLSWQDALLPVLDRLPKTERPV